jgi:predicted metal-dependent hydrolase
MLKVKLTQSEMYFLENFNGYKSFARRDNFSCQYALERYAKKHSVPLSESYDQLETSLIEKKVLGKSKNGAVRCKLDYNETKQLLAYQNDTKDDLVAQIENKKKDIQSQNEKLNSMPNLPWPESAFKDNERDQLKYQKETLTQLEARLKNLD